VSALTLGTALTGARDRIAAALGLERDVAALEAHVLLGHALQRPRAWLIAHRPDALSTVEAALFEQLVLQRLQGVPIAYLTGEREFFGQRFAVSPAVLIPRPDTELLVELALTLAPEPGKTAVLDLGTGSGAIALSIATHRPTSTITAVDTSPEALALARRNAESLGCENVRFVASDWFNNLDKEQCFDLIVANPPYLANTDPHLAQADVRFEPKTALVAGPTGLEAIQRIVSESRAFLIDNGHLLIEHGFEQGYAVRTLFKAAGFQEISTRRDIAGQERVTHGTWQR
jgi:release factor glutamine methyltransferase